MQRVAPNLVDRMLLFRPILADPPRATLAELRTTLNLDDLMDLHEVLNLVEAVASKAAASTP